MNSARLASAVRIHRHDSAPEASRVRNSEALLRMAFHRGRNIFGRLVPADRTDRLHDGQPIPVDPCFDDLAVRHLIPGAGGRLPLLAAWWITSEIPEVRAGCADAHGHKIALGDLVFEGHFEVRKGGHESARRRFEPFARSQVVEADEILAHKGRVEVPPHDISLILCGHASQPKLRSFPKPSRPPREPMRPAVSPPSQVRRRARGLPTPRPPAHGRAAKEALPPRPPPPPGGPRCTSVPTALPPLRPPPG